MFSAQPALCNLELYIRLPHKTRLLNTDRASDICSVASPLLQSDSFVDAVAPHEAQARHHILALTSVTHEPSILRLIHFRNDVVQNNHH